MSRNENENVWGRPGTLLLHRRSGLACEVRRLAFSGENPFNRGPEGHAGLVWLVNDGMFGDLLVSLYDYDRIECGDSLVTRRDEGTSTVSHEEEEP